MLRRFLQGIVAALVVACASPTLPLPPPEIPSIVPSSIAGDVRLVSKNGADPNAIIVIVNPRLPNDQRVFGAQADGSGSWDCDVVASKGDVLEITQESGNTRSASTDVQVP